MIVPCDDDYIYINASRLYVDDKDRLLMFLKEYLLKLPEDELEDAIGYIIQNPSEIDLNRISFEDLLCAYMCFNEAYPAGEFYAKCEHTKHGLRLIVRGRDVYGSFAKWKKIAGFLHGWIQWEDTYDNRIFRYVFAFGTMTEEQPTFVSDSMFRQEGENDHGIS